MTSSKAAKAKAISSRMVMTSSKAKDKALASPQRPISSKAKAKVKAKQAAHLTPDMSPLLATLCQPVRLKVSRT